MKKAPRRCWSCTSFIPRGKLSTVPSPGWRVGCPSSSSNWTSFSSRWARAWDGHEVVDLAVGRLDLWATARAVNWWQALRRNFPQRVMIHDWALERRAVAHELLAEIKHRLKCIQLLRILQRAPHADIDERVHCLIFSCVEVDETAHLADAGFENCNRIRHHLLEFGKLLRMA